MRREQPAFMTLGMFATQIELAGTATVWPRLFTVVAGHVTLFPPLGKVAVAVTPVGGVRMTVLITEFPFGVRLLNVAVSAAGDAATVDGDIAGRRSSRARRCSASANAANASAIKKPTHLRMLIILKPPGH